MRARRSFRTHRRPAVRWLTVTMIVALSSTLLSPPIGATTPQCSIVGTAVGERLVGTGHDDVLCGKGGNDGLKGYGGDDKLLGGGGRDHLRGGIGEDRLAGGAGSDRLRGGPGGDRLYGGAGHDTLRGQRGPDTLVTEDEGDVRDIVIGGPGYDVCVVDGGDILIGCETAIS
jgi:Ca2+-binding RTX toxin-like protein